MFHEIPSDHSIRIPQSRTNLGVGVQKEAWGFDSAAGENKHIGRHATLSAAQSPDLQFGDRAVLGVELDVNYMRMYECRYITRALKFFSQICTKSLCRRTESPHGG